MAKKLSLSPPVHAPREVFANEAIFFMSFGLLLLVAVVAQLFFIEWRSWFPGAESEKSLIKGVRAGVYTFLSHLS
ncbi:MAG: hypothetical protein U5L74_10460 [Ideonella sp.]|nr:hypothetical protein [Ideonella sp.]